MEERPKIPSINSGIFVLNQDGTTSHYTPSEWSAKLRHDEIVGILKRIVTLLENYDSNDERIFAMACDQKDKAFAAASALIGYCQSTGSLRFQVLSSSDETMINNWLNGLLERARYAGEQIDAIYNDGF